MKRLFFTLAIMLGLATTISAQEVGQVWVGGSLGINSVKVNGGDRETSFKIVPEIGYVFTENLGIGVRLGYANKTNVIKIDGLNIGGKNAFTVNPFLRYSFLKGNIGSLFFDGGGSYTYAKTGNVKTNVWEAGLRPGVAVNVSDKIALTGKFGFIGYQHLKVGGAKSNNFGLDFDLAQTEFGVSIVF
ncbi:MAG: porin family protein [Prevotella sp.]|jgi:hypothetical protein|nr:porin family protein [Prevotella sp.]